MAATVSLGVALLAPRLYSDPVGVDPYSLRLAGVATALAAAAVAVPRLRPAGAVLLAVASIAGPFALWVLVPHLLLQTLGLPLPFVAALAAAGAAQVLATVAIAIAGCQFLPADRRPTLRLGRFGYVGLVVTAAGLLAFVVLLILVPAVPVGRLAVQPVALQRDLVWLIPACALQAAAQELAFRGMLMGALERELSPRIANGGQALLFGLAHIAVQYEGPAGPFIPLTIVLGLVFGTITQRTRSLWPAIALHAIADLTVAVTIVPGLYGR